MGGGVVLGGRELPGVLAGFGLPWTSQIFYPCPIEQCPSQRREPGGLREEEEGEEEGAWGP